MPSTRTKEIHGVTIAQTQLQSKWYTPVDSRVKIAEQADPALVRREGAGYHVTSVQFVQVGDKWAYHCLVEYPVGSRVIKPGTDFIDLKDPSGIAKAETSAIGRALGLHGIAVEESIASAEEMNRVQPNTANALEMDEGERVVDSPVEPRKSQPAPPQRQAGASTPAPTKQPVHQPATDLPADDFDVLENTDLAQYIGIFGTDYRNEFVRLCGTKPRGGYTEEDGATWRAHLLAKAREKAKIETRHAQDLKALPVGTRGQ